MSMWAMFAKTGKHPCQKWHEKIKILSIAAKKRQTGMWQRAENKRENISCGSEILISLQMDNENFKNQRQQAITETRHAH